MCGGTITWVDIDGGLCTGRFCLDSDGDDPVSDVRQIGRAGVSVYDIISNVCPLSGCIYMADVINVNRVNPVIWIKEPVTKSRG